MTDRELLDYLEGESTLLQRMEEKEADMRRR